MGVRLDGGCTGWKLESPGRTREPERANGKVTEVGIEEVKFDISLLQQDFFKLRDRVTEAITHIGKISYNTPPSRCSINFS